MYEWTYFNSLFFITAFFLQRWTWCSLWSCQALGLIRWVSFYNGWENWASWFPDAHSYTLSHNSFCWLKGESAFQGWFGCHLTTQVHQTHKGRNLWADRLSRFISVTTQAASVVLIDGADGKCSLKVLSCLLDLRAELKLDACRAFGRNRRNQCWPFRSLTKHRQRSFIFWTI